MIEREKLITNKINDLMRLCERDCEPGFSDFLDGADRLTVVEKCYTAGFNTSFFGGYEEAERVLFGVFPEWQEAVDFPIDIIKISHSFGGSLSHRDYLGSILGLGIDRSKTGDILIDGNTAYVFVLKSISGYIINNLKKIGSRGVSVQIAENAVLPEKSFMRLEAVCASVRLDAVVGAAANVSRAVSADMINGGLVKLNHREADNTSRQISTGDLLSIRGYGRFILEEIGAETRKGRIHIILKKYI